MKTLTAQQKKVAPDIEVSIGSDHSSNTRSTSPAGEYDLESAKQYVSSKKIPARACRIVSIIVGAVALFTVGYVVYYFIEETRKPGQHPNFQGSVSLAEIEQHGTPGDCWVVYHGDVYDMSTYARRHPAGPDWITPSCGADGSAAYARHHGRKLLNSIPETRLGVYEEGSSFVGNGEGGDSSD